MWFHWGAVPQWAHEEAAEVCHWLVRGDELAAAACAATSTALRVVPAWGGG